jgi:His-Xaa-Ser system protein HxsD
VLEGAVDPSQSSSPPLKVVSEQDGEIVLRLTKGLYPLDAIYGAAYVFIDRAYMLLSEDAEAVLVHFRAKAQESLPALDAIVGELGNELLSQTLRRRIIRENQPILEAIVSQALAGASGVSSAGAPGGEAEDDLDFLDDPLGIAVPWEERFKKSGSLPTQEGPDTERAAGPGDSGGFKPTEGE